MLGLNSKDYDDNLDKVTKRRWNEDTRTTSVPLTAHNIGKTEMEAQNFGREQILHYAVETRLQAAGEEVDANIVNCSHDPTANSEGVDIVAAAE